ncbi:MAG: zeta toxin family protein, partial [Bacteroidota bacterium]
MGHRGDVPESAESVRPLVIGMAGGSGSGKSTVQRKILGAFGPDQISLLDHDSYYRDLS